MLSRDERKALILIHKSILEISEVMRMTSPIDLKERHQEIERLLAEPICGGCGQEVDDCQCDYRNDAVYGDDVEYLSNNHDTVCGRCQRFNCNCNLYPYE